MIQLYTWQCVDDDLEKDKDKAYFVIKTIKIPFGKSRFKYKYTGWFYRKGELYFLNDISHSTTISLKECNPSLTEEDHRQMIDDIFKRFNNDHYI